MANNNKNNDNLIIKKNPKSLFAEAIRGVKTNLAFSALDKDIKVIINTSPEAGDGKSFITANLAVAYAQEGKKVLLIDGDLRKGRQHQIFEITNVASGGYSNLVLNYQDNIKLTKYIQKTKEDNISLLPTGPTPPNPVELLGSNNNKKLIERLKREYDLIIIDCPPVIGLADAVILATLSDVNLITVSSKKTKMENLEKVKKLFDQNNIEISGVILNKINMSNKGYYNYYYSNSYYGEKI